MVLVAVTFCNRGSDDVKHFAAPEINAILASNAPQDIDDSLPSYRPGLSVSYWKQLSDHADVLEKIADQSEKDGISRETTK